MQRHVLHVPAQAQAPGPSAQTATKQPCGRCWALAYAGDQRCAAAGCNAAQPSGFNTLQQLAPGDTITVLHLGTTTRTAAAQPAP